HLVPTLGQAPKLAHQIATMTAQSPAHEQYQYAAADHQTTEMDTNLLYPISRLYQVTPTLARALALYFVLVPPSAQASNSQWLTYAEINYKTEIPCLTCVAKRVRFSFLAWWQSRRSSCHHQMQLPLDQESLTHSDSARMWFYPTL